MQDAFAHCEALVRAADKDRFIAALFAPAEHRGALHALYAFNIEIARVREIIREPLAGEVRLQRCRGCGAWRTSRPRTSVECSADSSASRLLTIQGSTGATKRQSCRTCGRWWKRSRDAPRS